MRKNGLTLMVSSFLQPLSLCKPLESTSVCLLKYTNTDSPQYPNILRFSDSRESIKSSARVRPLHNVDVLAVLDFQIPCSGPESPGFCLRYLLTKHEGHGRKLGRPRWLCWQERGTQRSRTARMLTFWGALAGVQIRCWWRMLWRKSADKKSSGWGPN